MAEPDWIAGMSKKREREMKSTRLRQSTVGPHSNMCTRIALTMIVILCLEQALTFEQQKTAKKGGMQGDHWRKRKKRAAVKDDKVLDAFTC